MIYELRLKYNIIELIKIANIPGSTYYYNINLLKDKNDKYANIKDDIKHIFHHKYKERRGYRAITIELNKSYKIKHKTVQRLMKEMGLSCKVRTKKYKSYKGELGKIAGNILSRDFNAIKPNEKWVTDITEFSLFKEKVYLSAILDLYNREIVSYTISSRASVSMVIDTIDKALCRVNKERLGLIIHSDQGFHYQHKQYQRKLSTNNITQSMSRKGNCLDNAVIENFFGILKTELFLQQFDSVKHFIEELHNYIDYYNNLRVKQKLNGMSPVEYRKHSIQIA